MEGALSAHENDENEKHSCQSVEKLDIPCSSSQTSCSSSQTENRHVRFSRAHVYYFTRQQGFSSVPERGGCSLGMAKTHFHSENYGALQYRRIRRMEKKIQRAPCPGHAQLSPKGKRKKLTSVKAAASNNSNHLNPGDARRVPAFYSPPRLSPQASEKPGFDFRMPSVGATPPPPCLSPPKDPFYTPTTSSKVFTDYTSDNIDTDSEASMDSFSARPGASSKSVKQRKKILPLHPTVRSRLLKQSGKTLLSLALNYCVIVSNSHFIGTAFTLVDIICCILGYFEHI